MDLKQGTTQQGAKSDAKRARRTPAQRDLHRFLISERLLEGMSERAIGAALGLTQSSVHRDIRALRKEWLEHRLKNRDELIAEELRFLSFVQREALSEWKRSKTQPVQKRSSKSRGLTPTPKAGEKVLTPTSLLLVEQQLKEEQRLGDPRYLEILQGVSTERSRLLGLYAPVKVAPTDPSGDAPYADVRERLLAVLEQQAAHATTPLPTGVVGAGEQPALAPAPVEAIEQADGSFDATGTTGNITPDVPEGFRLR